MPRDLDFVRRPRRESPTIHKPSRQPRSGSMAIAFVIIILVVGGILVAQYLSSKPTSAPALNAGQTPTTSTTPPTNSTTPTNQTKSSQAVIQIYDSGGGADELKKVSDSLAKTYQIKNLGPSQFDYDKTYVWYRKEFKTDANAIAKLLSDRDVSLKESEISGVFDILVYVGKK